MKADKMLQLQPYIDRLAARYGDLCDHRRWDEVAALFTRDCVVDAQATFGRTVTGRAELAEFLASVPPAIAHHPTSSYIVGVSDGVIAARMKMLVLFVSSIFSVDYRWAIVEQDGEYLIARQGIEPIGRVKLAAQDLEQG